MISCCCTLWICSFNLLRFSRNFQRCSWAAWRIYPVSKGSWAVPVACEAVAAITSGAVILTVWAFSAACGDVSVTSGSVPSAGCFCTCSYPRPVEIFCSVKCSNRYCNWLQNMHLLYCPTMAQFLNWASLHCMKHSTAERFVTRGVPVSCNNTAPAVYYVEVKIYW